LVISILEECLAQAGVNYRVLQGETAVEQRQDIVDEFNVDESITVFLLTTKAGGTGLNLTSANKVVLFDQSDNPQDDIQVH
jgi:SWI/SNF-related matrix-associated actin-dependent regulator 1 of chromatin subfamily A